MTMRTMITVDVQQANRCTGSGACSASYVLGLEQESANYLRVINNRDAKQ